MSTHPSDEALVAHAETPDKEITTHIATCKSCAVRARRLAAGMSLVQSERARKKTPDVNWAKVDAAIMAQADIIAAQVRNGTLKPVASVSVLRSSKAWIAGGVLAAAAAGVFAWKLSKTNTHENPVAHTTQQSSGGQREVRPNVEPTTQQAPQAQSVDGTILLAVSPVSYTNTTGSSEQVSARTVVRSGGRILVEGTNARAVIGVGNHTRLDVRAESEIAFGQLTTQEIVLALTKGTVRIDSSLDSANSNAVIPNATVTAKGWSVSAKDGTFVTTIEGNNLRLKVLRGNITIRKGNVEQHIQSGEELVLGESDGSVQIVSHSAQDSQSIDTSMLGQGTAMTVPAVEGQAAIAALTVNGTLSLPSGTTVLQSPRPLSLQATVGHDVFSLTLDPAVLAQSATTWQRTVRVATANPPAQNPDFSTRRPVHSNNTRTVEPGNNNQRTTNPPQTQSTPEPVPAQLQPVINMIRVRYRARSEHCFRQCDLNNSCGENRSGVVQIHADDAGRVASVSVTNFSSESVRQCLRTEAMALRFPAAPGGMDIAFPMRH